MITLISVVKASQRPALLLNYLGYAPRGALHVEVSSNEDFTPHMFCDRLERALEIKGAHVTHLSFQLDWLCQPYCFDGVGQEDESYESFLIFVELEDPSQLFLVETEICLCLLDWADDCYNRSGA